jgi:hypothetical protein
VLDLNLPTRTVAGVDLAADHQAANWYAIPPQPRVATVEGAPDLELLRFVSGGELRGGHLHLSVELAHPPAALEAARAALAEEQGDEAVEVRPVPVIAASAELLFLGREPDADGGLTQLLRRGLARTAARVDPPHTASFSLTLDTEGTRLLEVALRSGGAPVGVVYRLEMEGLWPAARVVAHVDWSRVYDHFSVHAKEGDLLGVADVKRIAESLVEEQVVVVQAVQGLVAEEGAPVPDLGPALAWVQQELVQRFCEPLPPLSREPARAWLGTVGEIFGVGSSFAVKAPPTQVERATADVDFQRSLVVTRTLTVQAHLADLLGGAPVDAHVADAAEDHPFFRRMRLRARAAAPLADLHLEEAVLGFGYGSFQAAMRLTPEAGEDQVETWADASPDGTWTVVPEVAFADDAPLDPGQRVALPAITGRSRELTVDLERLLGLVRLEVEGTTDERVLMTAVRMAQRRGEAELAERDLGLTPAAPSQVAWFRDLQPGDRVVATAKHLLADGRAVESAPFEVDTRTVRLPPPFPGVLTVQLVGDEDWTGLERVVVTLQKQEDQPAGTLVFERPRQVAAVNLDMPDPTDRSFRYRMSRMWTTGQVEEDGWVQTDVPVVAVGRVAANKLVVEVAPVGPELPQAGVLLLEVELSYLDPAHQVRDIRTAVFRAKADRFRWEVAIADPNHRTYEYRVTTHRTSGEKAVGTWTRSSARILPVPVVPVPT